MSRRSSGRRNDAHAPASPGVRGDRHVGVHRRQGHDRSMPSTRRNGSPSGCLTSVGDYVHASCTCRIGVVVDDDCRVNGYQRVVRVRRVGVRRHPARQHPHPNGDARRDDGRALVARWSRADVSAPSRADEFPHVFAPLQLRHRTLRSRINFGAHTANMGEDGLVSDSSHRLLPRTRARRCRHDRRRADAGASDRGAHARQLPGRRRFGHSRVPATDGCMSGCRRRRHRHDPPAVPRRSARRRRQLVRTELVTVGPALVSRR